ncbi:Copia protein [Vitis vinifera]|uniref:Copia protein n=1 Tax=Vitis vinifera TaxID=29760 RepID=A0A438CBX9_VITVI|nr:Copia protein [Vitis vinifera]
MSRPSTKSFFETGNAKFIEDVELSGRESLRKVNVQPITEIVDTPEIPSTQVMEQVQDKQDSKGNIVRYKARLVAKGFTQKEGIDYKETFSSFSSNDSFRIIMALVAHYDLELYQVDVKTAFLNGNIDETTYMIYRDRSRGILGLSQNSYIDKVLSRFGMSNYALGDRLWQKAINLVCTNVRKMNLRRRIWRGFPMPSAVGSLIRRSTSGNIFMLAGGAVSWKSVKQTFIASSTIEAEFIVCYEASNHGIWLWNFITELRIVDGIEKPLRIIVIIRPQNCIL